MFYKPRHAKKNSNSLIERTKRAVKFVYDETVWYVKWWKDIFKHTVLLGVKTIDIIDDTLDKI